MIKLKGKINKTDRDKVRQLSGDARVLALILNNLDRGDLRRAIQAAGADPLEAGRAIGAGLEATR